jgi:hypothetical protein
MSGDTLTAVIAEWLSPAALDHFRQFTRAMEFLKAAPRIQFINRKRCIIDWNYYAERWCGHNFYNPRPIGEAAFLHACHASGLMIHSIDGHSFVNLSERGARMRMRGAA